MRHGESNGRVKVEESSFIHRDQALQAVFIDFLDNGERRPRYPACYLYSDGVKQYVKIQYNSLIHYLSTMPDGVLSTRIERCVYTGSPQVIYVR